MKYLLYFKAIKWMPIFVLALIYASCSEPTGVNSDTTTVMNDNQKLKNRTSLLGDLIDSDVFQNNTVFNPTLGDPEDGHVSYIYTASQPYIQLLIYSGGLNPVAIGKVVGIPVPSNKRNKTYGGDDDHVMAYFDYTSYNFSTKTGEVTVWDLNRNSEIATYSFDDGDIDDIELAAPCDTNGNGDVGFLECYRCMHDACSTDDYCDFMCDMFDVIAAPVGCDVSMGAACVYISINY